MTARLRYALVVLALLPLVMSALTLWGATVYYHREQASQQRQAAQQQASQQRAGAAIEARLCTSLEPLAGVAGLKPPAGDPADNPSRAFEQHLVLKLAPLAQLGPDLGCKEHS